jgi:hypothetical protein
MRHAVRGYTIGGNETKGRIKDPFMERDLNELDIMIRPLLAG